jgi:hypothetical protein
VTFAVVLTEVEGIQPDSLGEPRLLDQKPDRLSVAQGTSGIGRDLTEGVDAQLESGVAAD